MLSINFGPLNHLYAKTTTKIENKIFRNSFFQKLSMVFSVSKFIGNSLWNIKRQNGHKLRYFISVFIQIKYSLTYYCRHFIIQNQ